MKKMKWLSMVLVFSLILTLAACGQGGGGKNESSNNQSQTDQKKPIVIKYPTFQVGVDSSAPVLKKNLEIFEQKYGNEIKIEVEEIPGSQSYVDKMKILLSADDLPDIVYAGGYNLLDMALEKDRALDLTPYLDADPDWKASFDKKTLEFNSRDGKVYSLPDEKSLIGYFYNKELFEKAGISKPAKTWDEFFKNCDALLAQGITPLSMDTADSGWLTSLWLNSIFATKSEVGAKFADKMMPTDYSFPEFIDAVSDVKKMFEKYTTKDAIGGKYENGANNFLSGKTAMIANGPWMISDFNDETKAPKGFVDKVGVAIYPEQGVFDAPMLGYFIASKDKEHQEAAVKVVKFFTSAEAEAVALDMIGRVPASTKVELSDAVQEKYPLLSELIKQSKEAKHTYNYYQAIWYPNVLDAMSTNYPALALSKMTPEEFAKALTEVAKKN